MKKPENNNSGRGSTTQKIPTLPVMPEVTFTEKMSTILEEAKKPGERLILIDEFSTVGNYITGGGNDKNKVLGKVINALRKNPNGSNRFVVVGHQHDNDILPIVKHNSDFLVEATGKVETGDVDHASIYTSDGEDSAWDDYQSRNEAFRVHGLKDIPDDSPYSIDSNHFAHIEFDLDNPEKQIQRGMLIDGWEAFQEEEDDQGGTQDDRAPSQCQAVTKSGDQCAKEARYPTEEPRYCGTHRTQVPDDISKAPTSETKESI
ncbi:hypothetical protein [Haloarcula regularis]|uniref:hypothetical protein n=1 Tax=Haloarcula regularis TaxID=3033392 RepID=UPI0023E8725D|nr:hypothetical protein [Halomicroarcula sp. SYNS111]